MELLAAVGVVTFTVVALVIGLRMLISWTRTREVTELLVGLPLLCLGPLAFPSGIIGFRTLETAPQVAIPLIGFAALMLAIGGCCPAIFTYRVFRPRSGFARGAAIALPIVLALDWILRCSTGGFDYRSIHYDSLFYLPWILRIAALSWAGGESLRYWRLMRRRLALGLADPVVTNRFALWGIGIGCGAISTLLALLSIVLTSDAVGLDARYSLGISAVALISAITLFLAFLPPQRYIRFLEARAESA